MSHTDLFWLPKPNANANIRLFCFPYAGGGAGTYLPWAENVHKNVELVLIQPPGRGARFTESPFSTMQCFVSSLLQNKGFITSKPYVMFGHSLGSRVAYELCCELDRRRLRLPEYFIASASKAPHLVNEKESIHHLPDLQFWNELSRLDGTPKEVLQNKELIKMLTPMLRADFAIAEEHHSIARRLPVPFLILAGNEDKGVSKEQLSAWQDLTHSAINIVDVNGGHFFVDTHRQEVLTQVNQVLADATKLPAHVS